MSESKPVGYVRFLRYSEVQEYRCLDCVENPEADFSPWSPLSANEAEGIMCDACCAELVPTNAG